MKLYRYEIGSDDGDEEIIAGKNLIGEFASSNDAINHIRHIYLPTDVYIEIEPSLAQYQVFTAIACNSESFDETLWLLDSGDYKRSD